MAEETAFQRALRERRARLAEEAPPTWDEDLIPEREAEGTNEGVDRLEAMRHDPILDIYRRLIGGKERSEGRDEVKVQCPMPDHPDNNPSANVNTSKNTWTCYACAVGGSVFDMAGAHWGYPFVGKKLDSSYMWEVKKRYGREVHGFDYDAATAPAPASVASAPAMDEDERRQQLLQREIERQRINLEARDFVIRERKAAVATLLDGGSFLDDDLANEDEDDAWTIEGLHQFGNNTILLAQKKTGKSTMMRQLTRSLVDGSPFLNAHPVRKVEGRIAYMNLEVIDRTFRQDMRDLGIKNTRKVVVHHLKGKPWDIQEDYAFESTVDAMKRNEIEVLIIDPFADAFRGEFTNEGINPFLQRIDELKVQTGIVDVFMPVHMGKDDTRGARGVSRIEDWADSIWSLTRDEMGTRFISAEGRRVSMEKREVMLNLNKDLVYGLATPASSKAAVKDMNKQLLKDHIKRNPGCGVNSVKSAMDGILEEKLVGSLLKEMRLNGELKYEQKGQSIQHYPLDES